MFKRFRGGLALALSLACPAIIHAADAADYSKEGAVIQNMTTAIRFSADGGREAHQTLSVRIQSEAAVRQFGVLSFAYSSESERITIEYVRVRKPDGSVVETPASSVLDVATELATVAPTYSDIRQKNVPVKALGVGDVVEYSFRSVQDKPELPGQFWYEQTFINDTVVLNQTLEIRVPKSKYVQVSNPKLESVREEGDQRVYLWKYSTLKASKPDPGNKNTGTENQPVKVQMTTFKSWEEVGNWWGPIAAEQAKITPAIEAKARALTAGLTSEHEKAEAIYRYVATKFRYISISFGAGKYRPHSADEVLANQYGDCKDKHTLFRALLKAAGIEAWPALVGAGIKVDVDFPSPAQFNHVITVLAKDGKYQWLDTTAEVAPFGFLNQSIRDQETLVIPETAKPVLLKTPVDPPVPSHQSVDVKASLDAEGTLTGHFDLRLFGDAAVIMRAAFREVAPAQWQSFVQGLAYGMGFGGDVSNVSVENLDDIEQPLHYAYDYKRKTYSDWQEHKITPPFPPLLIGPGEDADKPEEPFLVGAPGDFTYRASLQLPKGFSIELPEDINLTSDFADYSAHYSFKQGALSAERSMIVKKSKVAVDQWEAYRKFIKDARGDQTRFMALSETGGSTTAAVNNAEAAQLLQRAYASLQAHDLNAAQDLLTQAERLNPKQAGLWSSRAFVEIVSNNSDQAIVDLRKEIEYHPEDKRTYMMLSSLLVRNGRRDEAIELWRGALTRKSDDAGTAIQLANLLMQTKRYGEAATVLEKVIASFPKRYDMQALRVEALLRNGQKEQGLGEARKIALASSEPEIQNNLAYALADTETGLEEAQKLAEQAVTQQEGICAKAGLDNVESRELAYATAMAADWDTLGWVYFKRGDFAKAEKYLTASWQLSQSADAGDHLGQVYEKQHRRAAAIHMWKLALASSSDHPDIKQRLRDAEASTPDAKTQRTGSRNASVLPGEELGKVRTIPVAALPKENGSAEFFLLVSVHGIDEVRFISGSDSLKNAGLAMQSTRYDFGFPDAGPEKIIRRGILSCSEYTTPSCQLTLLLPSTVPRNLSAQ